VTAYDPRNWYWSILGDVGSVFSSAAAATVPLADESYRAWLATGNQPTRIASYPELYEVLTEQAPNVAARAAPLFAKAGLLTPAQRYQQAVNAGVRIESAAYPSVDGVYPVTDAFIDKLEKLASRAAETVGILDASGETHVIGTAVLEQLCDALNEYLVRLIVTEATALSGREAEWPEPLVKLS
jgi:hypothetical protein